MKTKLFLAGLTFCFAGSIAQAQHWCGTDHAQDEFYQSNPEQYKKDSETKERLFEEARLSRERHQLGFRKNNNNALGKQAQADGEYRIPVVVHVMHQDGPENISYEQIVDQLRIMNEDFARENPDAGNTPAPFISIQDSLQVLFSQNELSAYTAQNAMLTFQNGTADEDTDGQGDRFTFYFTDADNPDAPDYANSLPNGDIIDYTGAVSDTVNANAALSDSLVVIADAIPPFVTSAELTATQFTVTFNEAVTVTGAGQLQVIDPDTGLVVTPLNVTAAVASAGNTVLTWSGVNLPARSAFSNSGTIAAPQVTIADVDGDTFGGGAQLETVRGVFSFPETVGGDNLNHALLSWGSVDDARGNSWNDYHDLYVDGNGNSVVDSQEDNVASTNAFRLALADIPMYLATDTIVPFGVEVQFYTNRSIPAPKGSYIYANYYQGLAKATGDIYNQSGSERLTPYFIEGIKSQIAAIGFGNKAIAWDFVVLEFDFGLAIGNLVIPEGINENTIMSFQSFTDRYGPNLYSFGELAGNGGMGLTGHVKIGFLLF